MFYLITDENNKTWRDIQWGENVTHEEENPNYHFVVYNSPQVARYMYPCYEGIKNPKIWIASGENPNAIRGFPQKLDGFRSNFSKLTTISEFSVELPTNEQRINFAILCAMNVAQYNPFTDWALKYLRGEDQTKESAQNLNDKLIAKLDVEAPEDYTDCCFAVLAYVTLGDPVFAANAAHRAYHDSTEFEEPLNLDQMAQIANMISAEDIAALLS